MKNILLSPGPINEWVPDPVLGQVTSSVILNLPEREQAFQQTTIQSLFQRETSILNQSQYLNSIQEPILSYDKSYLSLSNPSISKDIKSIFLGFVVTYQNKINTVNSVLGNSGTLLPYRASLLDMFTYLENIYKYITNKSNKKTDLSQFPEEITIPQLEGLFPLEYLYGMSLGQSLKTLAYEATREALTSTDIHKLSIDTLSDVKTLYEALDTSMARVSQYQYSLEPPLNYDLEVQGVVYIMKLYSQLVRDTNTLVIRDQYMINSILDLLSILKKVQNG